MGPAILVIAGKFCFGNQSLAVPQSFFFQRKRLTYTSRHKPSFGFSSCNVDALYLKFNSSTYSLELKFDLSSYDSQALILATSERRKAGAERILGCL